MKTFDYFILTLVYLNKGRKPLSVLFLERMIFGSLSWTMNFAQGFDQICVLEVSLWQQHEKIN